MKVAVVVGHSITSQGASNKDSGVTEFKFFNLLADDIKASFSKYNMSDEIVIFHRTNGYTRLLSEINALDVDLVISLHANAYDTTVEGCEMLYYHKSEKGKAIAQIFQEKLQGLFLNKNRGIKPKSSEDKGGYLLKETDAPCIICEPFFIDNNIDYGVADELFKNSKLTTFYCEAIDEAIQYLKKA